MKRFLPSLNALRAFEAAARYEGFVAAAEELEVTPAAISHQVKGLEESLNVRLFVRHRRSVELTPVGRRLLSGVSDSFNRLAQLIDEICEKDNAPVTILVPLTFGAKWLAPRLDSFIAIHSDIGVRIQSHSPLMFERPMDADLAIWYEDPQTTRGTFLFEDWVFPVCAPVVRMALSAPGGLTRQKLLHDDALDRTGYCATWGDWLKKAGVPSLQPGGDITFDHAALALDAAQRAQGVALGRGSLIVHELRLGSLVRPFETAVPNGRPYVVTPLKTPTLRRAVSVFYEWLIAEAQIFRQENPRLVR